MRDVDIRASLFVTGTARVHGEVEAVEFEYVTDDSLLVPDQVD